MGKPLSGKQILMARMYAIVEFHMTPEQLKTMPTDDWDKFEAWALKNWPDKDTKGTDK